VPRAIGCCIDRLLHRRLLHRRLSHRSPVPSFCRTFGTASETGDDRKITALRPGKIFVATQTNDLQLREDLFVFRKPQRFVFAVNHFAVDFHVKDPAFAGDQFCVDAFG